MPEGFPYPLDEPLDGPGGGGAFGPPTPPGPGGSMGGRGGAYGSPAFSSPLMDLIGRKRRYGSQAQMPTAYFSGPSGAGSANVMGSPTSQMFSQAPGSSVEPSPGGGGGIGGMFPGGNGGSGGGLFPGGLDALNVGPNKWPYANEGVLRGVFSDMIGDARGQGVFNPMGNPQILDAIRKLFEGQGATRERSARLGLQANGSDPSLYGYASLMSQLGAQSDLSRQLGGAQLSEMQRANDYWRQILAQRFGQLYQPKQQQQTDWGAILGGLGTVGGALIGGPPGAAVGGAAGGAAGGAVNPMRYEAPDRYGM